MTQIEGPYSVKDVDGLKTPVYIYQKGTGAKLRIGEAVVKVNGKMTFDVQLDKEYQDIETGSFEVPMRYLYSNRPDTPQINWRHNCLTVGVHDGHPGSPWTMPLGYATLVYGTEVLEEIVVARIYNDAMQYVKYGDEPRMPERWAERTKEYAQHRFTQTLQAKLRELSEYYQTDGWLRDIQGVAMQIKQDKLNPHYQPLHSHDSVNMLCRILGTSASREASSQGNG